MSSTKNETEQNQIELEPLPQQPTDNGNDLSLNPNGTKNGIQSEIQAPPVVTDKEDLPNELFLHVKRGCKRERLKSALEKTKHSLTVQDQAGKTILHHAVEFVRRESAREMTEEILSASTLPKHRRQKIIDIPDQNGKTAIHIAAERGRGNIVSALLHHKPNLMVKCNGNGMTDAKTPLEQIYKHVPHTILPYYCSGVEFVEDHEKITLDFEKITSSSSDGKTEESIPYQEAENFRGLLRGSAEKYQDVLNHAFVQAFIYLKYNKAYPFIIFSMIMHIFWHAIYAYFVFTIYYTNCPWKQPSGMNESEGARIQCDTGNFENYELGLAVLCWIIGLIFFGKELFEIFTVPSTQRYFLEMENIGQLCVCASVIFTSWPIYEYLGGGATIFISPWQYRLASVVVFVVWALVLGQICKIQQLRYYIELFVKVFKSFTLFICTFASLLFAFAFSFCIIMPESKAFQSPWLAVPKVLVMMTGELNYDEVFHGEKDSGGFPYHYLTTQLLFSLFTILMSMILLNLLIGLAVSDTQNCKDKHVHAAKKSNNLFESRMVQKTNNRHDGNDIRFKKNPQELNANIHSSELSSMLEEIFLLECFAVRLCKTFGMKWPLECLSINGDVERCGNPFQALTKTFTKTKEISVENPNVLAPRKNPIGLKYTYAFGKTAKYPFPRELMEELCKIADANFENEDESIIFEDENGDIRMG